MIPNQDKHLLLINVSWCFLSVCYNPLLQDLARSEMSGMSCGGSQITLLQSNFDYSDTICRADPFKSMSFVTKLRRRYFLLKFIIYTEPWGPLPFSLNGNNPQLICHVPQPNLETWRTQMLDLTRESSWIPRTPVWKHVTVMRSYRHGRFELVLLGVVQPVEIASVLCDVFF